MQLSNFLRTVIKLDAASCLGMAALILPASAALQLPLGIGSGLMQAAALSLIPVGLFMLWLGARREAPAAFVWLVVLGNIGWAGISFFAVAAIPGITALGQAVVTGQALVVLALALAEWTGLRQSRAAIA